MEDKDINTYLMEKNAELYRRLAASERADTVPQNWCDGWPSHGHFTNRPTRTVMHELIELRRDVRFDFCITCLTRYVGDPCIGEKNQRVGLEALKVVG